MIEFLNEWDAGAVWRILHKMRPADAREVFALQPSDDPAAVFAGLQFVKDHMPFCEIAFKPGLMGRAVAFLAVTLESPRVGRVHMIATPEMRPREFAVWARRIRDTVPEICIGAGLHRVHCSTMADHRQAHTFLYHCGMIPEGPEYDVGREGEDFIRWMATPAEYGHCPDCGGYGLVGSSHRRDDGSVVYSDRKCDCARRREAMWAAAPPEVRNYQQPHQ